MKRASSVLLFLIVLSVVGVCLKRRVGRVIQEKRANVGEGLIAIRELQRAPFTVAGLLGLGDCIHRREYIPHPHWPSVSSISFIGESYSPSRITIEWSDLDSAKVSFDQQAVFYLEDGVWRSGGL